jgi:hypothetical protein
MLSGNGRHRRPRQAPALIVAAGVTGSAIAIPLLGAASANAADGTTWDKVANCETGGSWSKNSGNGLYGGLQLSQADWDKYGGLDYAQRPDLASRNQQIAVAEKLLDADGVGAFHTCGLTSGLTKDSGSAAIDTGVVGSVLGSSGSSASSDGSGSTGLSNSSGDSAGGSSSTGGSPSPSASPDSSPDTGSKSAKSGNSTSSSASPSDSPSAGSPSTGRAKSDDSDNSQQAVGSWNLVDTGAVSSDTGAGRHRGPSADESATAGVASGSYTVHAGDTLGSIADALGLNGGWRALYAENEQALGGDPNHIAPGQTLRLPAE